MNFYEKKHFVPKNFTGYNNYRFFASPFYAANKKVVIFPFAYTGDPSKAYIPQTIKKMLSTRLGGDGIELVKMKNIIQFLMIKKNQVTYPLRKSGNMP